MYFKMKMKEFATRVKIVKFSMGLFFILVIALTISSQGAIVSNGLSPKETIEFHYHKLMSTKEDNFDFKKRTFEKQIIQSVETLFNLTKLAPMALGNHWPKLNQYEKDRFIEALKIALQQNILKQIRKYSRDGLPSLKLISEETKDKFSKLNYLVSGDTEKKEITVFMLKAVDGVWKISNLKIGKNSLVRYYYRICKDLIDKYSVEYLEAELTGRGYLILEDFEDDEIGKLPRKWSWRKKDQNKNKPYLIKEEYGNKYLAADDNGESVILGKDIKWNLKKYPYISFKWRARNLPEGGDERFGKTVDSAAGIYIVYKKKLGLIPESVKYVWSTTLPVGSTMRRSGTGKPWMIVAESGEEHLGEWRTYIFNAYEAYKKTFGGDPPNKVIALGILSDANSTHSKAFADYDDIRALQKADADSGIKKFLQAE